MPTAAHTTQLFLRASAGAPGGSDEVDGVNKVGLTMNGELLDTTDFKDASGWHTFAQGLKGAEFKGDGQLEPTDSPQNLIRSSFLSGADLFVYYYRTPAATTGNKGFVATVKVENYEEQPEVANIVPFTFTFRVTGAVAVDS